MIEITFGEQTFRKRDGVWETGEGDYIADPYVVALLNHLWSNEEIPEPDQRKILGFDISGNPVFAEAIPQPTDDEILDMMAEEFDPALTAQIRGTLRRYRDLFAQMETLGIIALFDDRDHLRKVIEEISETAHDDTLVPKAVLQDILKGAGLLVPIPATPAIRELDGAETMLVFAWSNRAKEHHLKRIQGGGE